MTPDEQSNVDHAEWTILRDGEMLPVVNLFDNFGCEVRNPLRAFRCVVYRGGDWDVHRCTPDEIFPARMARNIRIVN